MTAEIDVRVLVNWLGVQGAKAALRESRTVTVESLSEIAARIGIDLGKKATRKELIDEIIKIASRRVEVSLDKLFEMSQEELVSYFETVGAQPEELLDLVKRLDLDPKRREGLQNLVHFVAREISETGRFMRIASSHNGPKPSQ